jgi:CRISPR-associated endonuclease/helicase Cas3
MKHLGSNEEDALTYSEFFRKVSGNASLVPFAWQDSLAAETTCVDRLIRVPTGFGKTLGVFSTWLWHRVHNATESWPRRLVWCLPMRVLVEQTDAEVRAALSRLDLLWDEDEQHGGKVGVHLLMGGSDAGEWHLYPEHCAVLIGTQDMLLSRALNRGYGGAGRARWPVEFGLVNSDALWIMDEVQLMDVGLATSGQMQAFREEDVGRGKMIRPSHTWWMSATLQRSWLGKSPETADRSKTLAQTSIPPAERKGNLWDDVAKPLTIESIATTREIAEVVARAHVKPGRTEGPTVVVLNKVSDAVEVYEALRKNKLLASTELKLVHSRFRPHERAGWRQHFLNRNACGTGVDRIIVATQVIEAGVDISAAVLITALAPWPSLVQRFGRAARWGGKSDIIVLDQQPKDDKAAAPYTKDEIDASREALTQISDAASIHLEQFEETASELLPRLYPYEPRHLLLRGELEELFDITPDLSGADIDISRFIRSGDERDLQVFWQTVPMNQSPDRKLRASRAALCAVPFLKAREWLCGKEKNVSRLRKNMKAWVWDWLDGEWRVPERRDLYPGQVVLVSAECGGYDAEIGWSPASEEPVAVVPPANVDPEDFADSSQDDEALSAYPWQTIAVHGREVGRLAAEIGSRVTPNLASIFDLAGRWHDAGKAHEAFQNSIESASRPDRRDLAKAPQHAWLPLTRLYPDNEGKRRSGFRHELASTLALFGVLQRHQPDHEALLGPWKELLQAAGATAVEWRRPEYEASPLEEELLHLNAPEFDLLAYLVCSHHGKVRVSWHASPADQKAADDRLRLRGIRDGELLAPVLLATATTGNFELPATPLNLAAAAVGLNPHTGRGWTERVLTLLDQFGPFTLALYEAILRAADCRASRDCLGDPLLQGEAR